MEEPEPDALPRSSSELGGNVDPLHLCSCSARHCDEPPLHQLALHIPPLAMCSITTVAFIEHHFVVSTAGAAKTKP
jgi:hypothetical protein